jgi:hypothetical protein
MGPHKLCITNTTLSINKNNIVSVRGRTNGGRRGYIPGRKILKGVIVVVINN